MVGAFVEEPTPHPSQSTSSETDNGVSAKQPSITTALQVRQRAAETTGGHISLNGWLTQANILEEEGQVGKDVNFTFHMYINPPFTPNKEAASDVSLPLGFPRPAGLLTTVSASSHICSISGKVGGCLPLKRADDSEKMTGL